MKIEVCHKVSQYQAEPPKITYLFRKWIQEKLLKLKIYDIYRFKFTVDRKPGIHLSFFMRKYC